jgi:hypothetical protein
MCTPNASSDKSSLLATTIMNTAPRRAATSSTANAKIVNFSSKEADQMRVQTRSELKETGQEREVWYNTEELIKINLESLQTASLMKQYVIFVAAQNQSSDEQAQEQDVPVEQCCLQLPQKVLDMLEETCFGGHASRGIFHLCDEGSRRRKKINKFNVVSRVLKQQAAHPLNDDNVRAISKVARGSSRKARAMAYLRGVMDQLAARSAEDAVAEPKTNLKRAFSETKSTDVEDTVLDSTPWKKSRREQSSITGVVQA